MVVMLSDVLNSICGKLKKIVDKEVENIVDKEGENIVDKEGGD